MDGDQKQLVQLLPLLPVLAELGRTEHVTETAGSSEYPSPR